MKSKLKNKIPAIPSYVFFRKSLKILKNPLPFHHENFVKNGNIFQLNIGFKNSVIFCRDADFLKYVLQKNQKNFRKSDIQTVELAKYIGLGLLTSEGELWAKQRKLIQPSFHKSHLAMLMDKVYETIQIELNKIELDKEFDVFPLFNDLAFLTVVKSLFSAEARIDEIKRLQEITEVTQRMLVKELRQPYLKWWFQVSGQIKKHIELTDESRNILLKIVNRRRKSNSKKNDLLDMLLDAKYEDGTKMSEAQLLDEILILFVAGHETTSNALCFITELLARNPEAQIKLRKEIFKLKDENLETIEMVKNARYAQCVIEESMRLYPPAYFIDRVNVESDQLGDYSLPEKSNLLFSIYEIHRHPDYWENPLEFIPERFLKDRLEYSKYYFPFGAGQRMCIGNNFAMYEMVLVLYEMLSRFEIVTKKDPIQLNPLITLKPKEAKIIFRKCSDVRE